jgi:membrane peptidoglycan carboxypeptidase
MYLFHVTGIKKKEGPMSREHQKFSQKRQLDSKQPIAHNTNLEPIIQIEKNDDGDTQEKQQHCISLEQATSNAAFSLQANNNLPIKINNGCSQEERPESEQHILLPANSDPTQETNNGDTQPDSTNRQLSDSQLPVPHKAGIDSLIGADDENLEETAKRSAIVLPSKNTPVPNLPTEKDEGECVEIASPPEKNIPERRTITQSLHHIFTSLQPPHALVPVARTQLAVRTRLAVRTPTSIQEIKAQRHKKILLRHLSRKHMRLGREAERHLSARFWTTIIILIAVSLTLFLSITGGGLYAAYSFYTSTQDQYLDEVFKLRSLMPKDNLKVYDRNDILIAQDTTNGLKTEVPLNQISPFLINATVATEDKNFWNNEGIDVTRILQSAIDDLRNNRIVAGGSTITQQLIKNLILGQNRDFQRKLTEVALIPDINIHYSKSDILEMYLNSNNYGGTAYGPEAAATIYFGLEAKGDMSAASQLDLAQAALLAGIPNSPTAFNPILHPQASFNRFLIVLNLMLSNGYITKVQMLDAIEEAKQPDFLKPGKSFRNRAPHFYYFIHDQLHNQIKEQYPRISDAEADQIVARSDMKVYTTLDITLQDKIQKIAQDQIAQLASQNVTNAAEILIDFRTGAILSMLGSLDYYSTAMDGKYNVTLAYRQPGSSFKPYVYATAFSKGISPGQGVADTPLRIPMPGENPPYYSPQNADMKTHGQMTIRCALQNSFNIPAVRTLQYVGIDAAMEMAKNMGITSWTGYPGYSLVLGGLGVRLLDHTSAFGTFANDGVHVPYYGIEKIIYASTNETIQHKLDPGTRVISPQLAYMMTSVLSDNVSRTSEFGKCSMLYLFSNSQSECYAGNPGTIRPAAAKTGTTNDFRDNWTMGYTSDYVMGVWAGNNDNSPMDTVLGVVGAAPIWHYGLLAAEEGRPVRDFVNPGGLKTATVTYPNGIRSTDLFLNNQNPASAASNAANQILTPSGSGGIGSHFCLPSNYW